ncbi:polyketide synthase [Aureobasidium sp. EXF-3400]|nr:polyketide synthase [Aureobasidium sp. EXF-3400]
MMRHQPIAITGLSCRFPGDGDNLENFWSAICSGKSAWSTVPEERFNVDAFWSSTKTRNTSVTRGAHFLRQDVSAFDTVFFSLPKAEAEAMDPQHRIMIEVAYEALEQSGLRLDKIAGSRTGVFMGHFTSDYKEMIYRDPENAPTYSITGACKTSLANRISWLWDLRGPSFTMDTACSSSLVALHLACQSLQTGESDIAIVGGTNLLLNPEMFMYLSNQAFLSPDGKCKSFDEAANGYGRGEGFGCIILKRVDDAVAASDPIRAVIRGTGSNQDGHTKGLTLPNADAQAGLIQETYRVAGLDFNETRYVEAHGTGTKAGDYNETKALGETIASSRTAADKLVIGSVKSNIGHLEAAAGIAAIIKSVLILERGLIPPSINFNNGNPEIKFEEWKLRVATELTAWPKEGLRRISVNSFGYGGTNAHAILEDAQHYLEDHGRLIAHAPGCPPPAHSMGSNSVDLSGNSFHSQTGSQLFVWSAQDKDGLQRVQRVLSKYIEDKTSDFEDGSQETERFVSHLAYTLSERRSRLQWKMFGLASSPAELCTIIEDETRLASAVPTSRAPRVGFVFTGQGAQWPRMGVQLMAYSTFSESVKAADVYLCESCECPWSVIEELQKAKSTSKLHLAEYSQTLCTVLQIALVDLLKSWNIIPTAVAGHSSSEIAAAYTMGALRKEDAWKIAFYRGVLSSEMRINAPELDGSMMAVGLSPEQAEDWISKVSEGRIVVACVNSPSSVTISGDTPGIDQLLEFLAADGIFARKLQVDTAYHSLHMQVVAQDYYDLLADIEPLAVSGRCTMHSSVTGSRIEASQLGAVNWVKNLTSPVKFSSAIHDMMRPGNGDDRASANVIDLFVEIGPHSALQGPSTQTLKAHGIVNVPYLSVLTRNQNAVETAMTLAGALFARGCDVDIAKVNGMNSERFPQPLIDVPSYPWNHSQRFWHESRVEREYLSRKQPRLRLIGAPTQSFSEGEHSWRGFLRTSEEPWIADHKIQGAILYPAAGFLAMALEAASQSAEIGQRVVAYKLRDIQLTSAAIMVEDEPLECIVQVRPHMTSMRDASTTWTEFTVTSSPDGKTLSKNCSGLLCIEYESDAASHLSRERVFELENLKAQYHKARASCKDALDPTKFYSELRALGLEYGPAFTNLLEAYKNDGQSVGLVGIANVPSTILEGHQRPHVIHPGTLDAILHLAFAAVKDGKDNPATAMVPKSIEEVTIAADIPFEIGRKLPGFSNAAKHGLKDLKADITVLNDAEGLPIIQISGFLCSEVPGASSPNVDHGIKSTASKISWRAAVDLISNEDLSRALNDYPGTGKLVQFVRLLHHSNPGLSILELAMQSEDSVEESLLVQRKDLDTVTKTASITVACRDPALKSQLTQDLLIKQDITLELLDLTQNPTDGNLSDSRFDLVLVPQVDISFVESELAVKNILSMLNHEGRLCMIATYEDLDHIRGALDEDQTETYLMHDSELSQRQGLLIVKKMTSHVNASNGHTEADQVMIIQEEHPTAEAQLLIRELTLNLEHRGYSTAIFQWGSDITGLAGKSCISFLELNNSMFYDISEMDFNHTRSLILDAASVFWVTAFDDPSAFMIDGLARVVRNETPGLSLRTFHAAEMYPISIERLAKLIQTAYLSRTGDDEYRVQGDIVCVSRIEQDPILNKQIDSILPGSSKTISDMVLGQAPYPLRMFVGSPGMLDSISMEFDDSAEDELDPHMIEIQVQATALNFREVMVAMGQVADSKLGLDAAGIVSRVGSSVTKFKTGDRVAMYGHGAHRTRHRSRAEYCASIPENLTFEQAATIPTVHCTAWNALIRLAKVQKGQSILIHAAAGGVGQAAIQIAKHFEMEIFATVSSDAKRQLIKNEYGIPDDHIFNSRDLSFVQGIKRMTDGRGVDVVLNSLAGEALRQTWHCVAPFGYFIEIGLRDILANTRLDMKPFIQDSTFSFFNLTHIEACRPDIMGAIVEGAFDLIRRGITRPVEPLITFPISETETAFRLMQTGKHLGKIAFSWGEEHIVPVVQREKSTLKLDPNAVCLLVGGFGGLGRSLSHKLVDLGARKLCFISRSGAESVKARKLVRDLEQRNVVVQVHKCDISDSDAVAQMITVTSASLGRIQGVFQCAMVLRDTLFVNMTHKDWIESTRPKVQGSWNLHRCLPDVDFFVTMSSFAAIFGNRGQSNYSAAGAYEDALAYQRRALGQRAITLDLSIMREIGVLAESGITESLRDWEVPYGIGEAEFHALVERAVQGDLEGTISPQVLTGLATKGSAVAAGIETPFYLDNARFAIMAMTGARGGTSGTGSASDSAPAHVLVGQAKSLEDAANSVTECLVKQVAKMLQTPASEIDSSRFLHSYGIDSLVAIEIVNWALKEVKSNITVFDVLAGVPITTLCNKIASKSAALSKDSTPV